MLAHGIEPEPNSPLGKEMQGPLEEEQPSPVEDAWAGINFNLLCRHLNIGSDEQTHPWDPVLINMNFNNEEKSEFTNSNNKQKTSTNYKRDSFKDTFKKVKQNIAFTAERELAQHVVIPKQETPDEFTNQKAEKYVKVVVVELEK